MISSGTSRARAASVRRTPLPVRLRGSGKSSRMSAIDSSPTVSVSGVSSQLIGIVAKTGVEELRTGGGANARCAGAHYRARRQRCG